MKYLKYFENIVNGWIIRTDEPYFEISLRKIGIPEQIIKDWLENKNIQNYKKLVVYVGVNGKYSHFPVDLLKDFREIMKYEIIEPNEDDFEEWRIRKDANKYNL